jgi:hypothetical protein
MHEVSAMEDDVRRRTLWLVLLVILGVIVFWLVLRFWRMRQANPSELVAHNDPLTSVRPCPSAQVLPNASGQLQSHRAWLWKFHQREGFRLHATVFPARPLRLLDGCPLKLNGITIRSQQPIELLMLHWLLPSHKWKRTNTTLLKLDDR